jgi:hypothetical protein
MLGHEELAGPGAGVQVEDVRHVPVEQVRRQYRGVLPIGGGEDVRMR